MLATTSIVSFGEIMTFEQEVVKPVTSGYVELFILDGTAIDSSLLFYFTNSSDTPIQFGANTYTPFPIMGTGWSVTSGQPPRPKLTISNVTKVIQPYIQQYQDLSQMKVTRIRTLAKFLASGSSPDANAHLPLEQYYVSQMTRFAKDVLEFELVSFLEAPNAKLPAGQVLKDNTPGVANMYCPGLSTIRFRG